MQLAEVTFGRLNLLLNSECSANFVYLQGGGSLEQGEVGVEGGAEQVLDLHGQQPDAGAPVEQGHVEAPATAVLQLQLHVLRDLHPLVAEPETTTGLVHVQGSRTKGKGSGVKDQGSRTKGKGSGVKVQGSRLGGQGPGVKAQGSRPRGQSPGVKWKTGKNYHFYLKKKMWD